MDSEEVEMTLTPGAGPPVEGPRMTQSERRASIEMAKAIAEKAKRDRDPDKEDLAKMIVRLLETG